MHVNAKRDTPILKILKFFEKMAKEIHLFSKFEIFKKNDKRDTPISKILIFFEKMAKEIHLFTKLNRPGHPYYASRFWGLGLVLGK